MKDIRVILHDIRSVHNVGSMFRTSDAIGVSQVYVSGYSPAPTDRFKQPRKDFAKVALGAEKTVAWSAIDSLATLKKLLKQLKQEGFQIIAVEQDPRAIDYKTYQVPKEGKVVFLFGNETEGVAKDVLDLCDAILEIPMRGKKESLNVAVSYGITLFRLLDTSN